MNVVLVEPEIPQNTGNVARSCVATGTTLHLVRPLGFSLGDKYLRRAGMDYWQRLSLILHDSIEEFLEKVDLADCVFVTKKARHCYTSVDYEPRHYLVFGKESEGLPESLLAGVEERAVRIPMVEGTRSLNLSSAVAVVLFEGLRRQGFPGLERSGNWLERA